MAAEEGKQTNEYLHLEISSLASQRFYKVNCTLG